MVLSNNKLNFMLFFVHLIIKLQKTLYIEINKPYNNEKKDDK